MDNPIDLGKPWLLFISPAENALPYTAWGAKTFGSKDEAHTEADRLDLTKEFWVIHADQIIPLLQMTWNELTDEIQVERVGN